ncbi:hypothetical protein Ciccas_004614 [Cichlidogyrus casuarinus]|uniref:Uncharacterized protein n=1 Tax=Cichlidogyrus casuarinus TaxID=1844966 RepID=A0ABD2QB01_9PLAT
MRLRLFRNTPQGRASVNEDYQKLLDTIQGMSSQYATKKSPVGDISSEFYRRLLSSPLNNSPLFKQNGGRGFTPLPVELDALSFCQTSSGRTTSSNVFRTPSLSPFTFNLPGKTSEITCPPRPEESADESPQKL